MVVSSIFAKSLFTKGACKKCGLPAMCFCALSYKKLILTILLIHMQNILKPLVVFKKLKLVLEFLASSFQLQPLAPPENLVLRG